jgi:hypothetical protein
MNAQRYEKNKKLFGIDDFPTTSWLGVKQASIAEMM